MTLDCHRADQVQGVINKLLWCERPLFRCKPVCNSLDARQTMVAKLIHRKVDPLGESTAVYPLASGVPTLYGRWGHKVLTHKAGRGGSGVERRLGESVCSSQFYRPGYQLGGTLHLGEAGFLKEVRVEEYSKYLPNIGVGLEIGVAKSVNRIRVSRGDVVPGWYLGLVSNEEVVQVTRYEPRRSGLLNDYVDYILAVEPARVAQERLLAVVVVVSNSDG